ncbi:hypothetical protein EDD35_2194 [Amycolatopsis thermoflava]|uniref:Uncharacterized protein n=1 Tax=Amycolatopsis thermoflava TaxID=84480 RepID=A0A3N2GTD8_9PSEU|nr:hypothetical protein EDD35_2194 [Amycolatopsis thermoflava]
MPAAVAAGGAGLTRAADPAAKEVFRRGAREWRMGACRHPIH